MPRRRFLRSCLQGASVPLAVPWALAGPVPAGAGAPPVHIYMITFRGETDVDKGFRAYLAEAGVAVRYTVRDLGQDVGRMAALRREIRALAPDLIYVWGTPATLALVGPFDAPADSATSPYIHDIPVVFALVAAPVRARIVASERGHGRNVAGVVHVVPFDVQLRAMQRYRPLQRLGVLYNAAEANARAIVQEARQVCAQQGVELLTLRLPTNAQGQPSAEHLAAHIAQLHGQGAQWLYLLPDTFVGTLYERITPLANQLQLPCFGAVELAVRTGGALLGLVSRYYAVGQLAGAKALEILQGGHSPEQAGVQTLPRFALMVNMAAAHRLRMYPPMDMLNFAEIIAVGDTAAGAT